MHPMLSWAGFEACRKEFVWRLRVGEGLRFPGTCLQRCSGKRLSMPDRHKQRAAPVTSPPEFGGSDYGRGLVLAGSRALIFCGRRSGRG